MRTFIRPAEDADLGDLAAIEQAADAVFAETFGTIPWGTPPSGQDRAAQPGFLLVAAESEGGRPIGFAHVLDAGDQAHLEQVSVTPEHARRGHGSALVRAALDLAAERGATRIGLRTFADIPWNAPFYQALGFVEQPSPDDAFHAGLIVAEERAGPTACGPCVYMAADLHSGCEMDAETFEALVIDELDKLPDDMVDGLDNVVFVVEDAPEDGSDLFGLYEGFALTERSQYGMGELPDRIIVYRTAHLDACSTEQELRDEVHTTLVHEIAHFYGIDDDQLQELGWA